MAARIGSAQWQGTLKEGVGRVTIGDGAYTGPYSFSSRFEDGVDGVTPEQMIAAAHAACFTMALNNELFLHDHAPASVETTASVTLRSVHARTTSTSAMTRRGVSPRR